MPKYFSRQGRRAGLLGVLISCVLIALIGAHTAAATPTASPVQAAFHGDSYTFGVGATRPTDRYAYAGHPNNLGYAHIAKLLEADLQTLGVH